MNRLVIKVAASFFLMLLLSAFALCRPEKDDDQTLLQWVAVWFIANQQKPSSGLTIKIPDGVPL